jgi:hypothetical protein
MSTDTRQGLGRFRFSYRLFSSSVRGAQLQLQLESRAGDIRTLGTRTCTRYPRSESAPFLVDATADPIQLIQGTGSMESMGDHSMDQDRISAGSMDLLVGRSGRCRNFKPCRALTR